MRAEGGEGGVEVKVREREGGLERQRESGVRERKGGGGRDGVRER